MARLRVCIDARLFDGISGGIQQVVIGLANGLSDLDHGLEDYFFLVYPGSGEWLKAYIRGPCQLLYCSAPPPPQEPNRLVKSFVPFLRSLWHNISPLLGRASLNLRRSDGTIEKAGIDVMHFTGQSAFLTEAPSIYHPHDLQHLHLPQFFTPRVRMAREIIYRTFCRQARMVAVSSSWVKSDIIHHYALPSENVQVVPLAPTVAAYEVPTDDDLAKAKRKFSIPDMFIFYPAQTWAHKNHLELIEALAHLRDNRGLTIPAVFSGHLNEFYSTIERQVHRLKLLNQVQFLGFVSPLELQCLYRLCRCVVIPTKFEAGSFPLFEAFHTGVPVACSNVTSLPVQAAGAALIFDPNDPLDISAAIERLWTDEGLRHSLVARGKERVASFTWDRTARSFRAHYRRIASRSLTEEDISLITGPSII